MAEASAAPAPFGIMVTDSESRKSVVLLEAPVLEAPGPSSPAEDTDSEASAVEAEEEGPVVPIMDGVEEAIRQAVRDETALEVEEIVISAGFELAFSHRVTVIGAIPPVYDH